MRRGKNSKNRITICKKLELGLEKESKKAPQRIKVIEVSQKKNAYGGRKKINKTLELRKTSDALACVEARDKGMLKKRFANQRDKEVKRSRTQLT